MTAHRLELEHRGPEHRHRWRARCSCGWSAIPLRLKRSAIAGHKAHAKAGRRAGTASPRPVTPDADLPEELRQPI